MCGRFRYSGGSNAKTSSRHSRLRNVCTSMEERPGNGLNKKSLSPASLNLKMKAKLLETMKEIPLLILK